MPFDFIDHTRNREKLNNSVYTVTNCIKGIDR